MWDQGRVINMSPSTEAGLETVRTALSDIVGEDLADSLVKCGVHGGKLDLNMQIAINDGLDALEANERAQAVALIDAMMQKG